MKISSIDITEALKKAHKHNNYDVIEKITENSKGEMLYDSKPLSSSELSSASLGSVIYDIPSKSVVADTDSIVFFDKTLKTTKKIKISNLKYMIKNIGAKFALFVGGQFETNGKTIDYVNFKGEGTLESERYNSQGWGLLQVLQNMDYKEKDRFKAFQESAKDMLSRRIKNSPKERGEERWRIGWNKRLDTYLPKEAK